ncbi:sarcosine oxidase subunit gamma family protein [Xanthobacter oligotrophicus]|uniref:Sarcosine oxidase subunit gamma family protein n=1 Tax=Xanthobacter oligotrophicus TaxID=2607286 RepID=A0ABW7A351_9HYPH
MLDTPTQARRTPVLPAGTGGIVSPLPPADRFVLRLRGFSGTAGGFDLSGTLNTAYGTPERFAARLGPDEWLLVLPDGEGPATRAALESDLSGRFFSLVEAGHRNVGIAVTGPHAADVLNAGIALDLSNAAFPQGSATRTLLGKADVVVVRLGGGFRVECWRSFAPYVFGFLTEVAQEFA